MRLTADIILRANSLFNPIKERELDLRGYKIAAIENLGVMKDGFDCLDFSDNEIMKLENFPRLKRLSMLLFNNNHISRIQDDLSESIGNLKCLILTGNKVANLEEINKLACLKNLVDNPVTKRKNYREYVIFHVPQLTVLDYSKITLKDRDLAESIFGQGDTPSNVFNPGEMNLKTQPIKDSRVDHEMRSVKGDVNSDNRNQNPSLKSNVPVVSPKKATPIPVEKTKTVSPVKERQETNSEVADVEMRDAENESNEQDNNKSIVGESNKNKSITEPDNNNKSITEQDTNNNKKAVEEKKDVIMKDVSSVEEKKDVIMKDVSAVESEKTEKSPPRATPTKKLMVSTPSAMRTPSTSTKQLKNMKVSELKEQLRLKGLSVSGLKADLLARLQDAVGEE